MKQQIINILNKQGIRHFYKGKDKTIFIDKLPTGELPDSTIKIELSDPFPVHHKTKRTFRQNTNRTGLHKNPETLIIVKKGRIVASKEPKFRTSPNIAVPSKPKKLPTPEIKPGRNEACLCGSGNKYKHCCLAENNGSQRIESKQVKATRGTLAHA